MTGRTARLVAALLTLLNIPIVSSQAQTIGGLVRDGANFTVLESLLLATGLLDVLDMPDLAYTVFAPDDLGFGSSDQTLVENLKDPSWVGHAACVLRYHIADRIARSANLTEGQELETLDSDLGTLTVSLNPIRVNGIDITAADVEATNGLVHVISGLLTPKCVTESITAYLRSKPEYAFLTSLLDTNDLASAVDAASPVTMFAPNNTAFEALDTELQQRLQADPTLMQVVLLSHLFGGNLYSDRLDRETTVLVDDVLGKTVFVVNSTGKGLTINGIGISETDVLLKNGVINVVNELVLPLFVDDLIERMSNLTSGELSLGIFARSLEASNFTESLAIAMPFNETVPYTVFAPDDRALGQLTQASLERLTDPVWYYHNRQLWRHHIVVGLEASVDTLLNLTSIDVATQENLTVSEDSNQRVVVGGSAIVHPFFSNLFAVNGAVHMIDRVLIPQIYKLSILDVAASNDDFSVLVALLNKAKLDTTLGGASPLTFFAPTDLAFAEAGITAESPADESVMRTLLHHILEGNHYFSDLRDNETLVSLMGSTLTFTIDEPESPDPTYMVEGAELLDVALPNNGIIYVLDKVLTPPEVTSEPTVLGSEVPSSVPTLSPRPTEVLLAPSTPPPSEPTSDASDRRGRIFSVLVVLATSSLAVFIY